MSLQMWASFRAQTLARTVRGLMYHAQAVRLLAVVEGDAGVAGGTSVARTNMDELPTAGHHRVRVSESFW